MSVFIGESGQLNVCVVGGLLLLCLFVFCLWVSCCCVCLGYVYMGALSFTITLSDITCDVIVERLSKL